MSISRLKSWEEMKQEELLYRAKMCTCGHVRGEHGCGPCDNPTCKCTMFKDK